MKTIEGAELPQATTGTYLRIVGLVICRLRPGTAKGFACVSLEDETENSECDRDAAAF